MILLLPVYLIIIIAIEIDDPGPILFAQRRVGKDKRFFSLHKFRSMKMSTPHDVPTHMLENPEQYITKVGGFLRKSSLDELPQILDIFVGNMSIIGPRPALWNQDYLTAERDKYGANDIKPGLTGWAQINGRDELDSGNPRTGSEDQHSCVTADAFLALSFPFSEAMVLSKAEPEQWERRNRARFCVILWYNNMVFHVYIII